MSGETKIEMLLRELGWDVGAIKLRAVAEKALKRGGNQNNPEKAKATMWKMLRDEPRTFFDAFPREVLEAFFERVLRRLVQEEIEAAEAARREEARAGQSSVADKARLLVPAAPRLNDGVGGQTSLAAQRGQSTCAAPPSPNDREGGHTKRAVDGHLPVAVSRSPFGEGEGHTAVARRAIASVPAASPSSSTAGASHGSPAGKAMVHASAPAVERKAPTDWRTKRTVFHRETQAEVGALVAQRSAEVVLQTFKIHDGRDFAAVPMKEYPELIRYYEGLLNRAGEIGAEAKIIIETAREVQRRERAGERLTATEKMAVRQLQEGRLKAGFKGLWDGGHEGARRAVAAFDKQGKVSGGSGSEITIERLVNGVGGRA